MFKDIINQLVKKSDLNNTEYFTYNENRTPKKDCTPKANNYNKITTPNFCDYVVLDFETTGLSPKNDKILEIGAIKVIENKIIGNFNTLINPEIKIPPFITSKINISNEMVEDKPKISEVIHYLKDFIDNFNLVIHNAKFDMGFLLANFENYNLSANNSVLDTVSTTKLLFPQLKKYNLKFLCEQFNIENKNAHRAISDAMATHHLYQILQKKAAEN